MLQNLLKNIQIIFATVILLTLTSCFGKDPYLYDKPGFDSGTMPGGYNPNSPKKSAPDYYRQPQYPNYQPAPYQQQPQQQQYYYQPYAAPQQQYQQPQGGSRFYTNPYAIPAAPNGYQYYDTDQYYVAPYQYNNIEDQLKKNISIPY